jgi:hypothetical protein
MLVDGKKTPTERFWDTKKEMKAVGRILDNCLDGHSRSSMVMYLFQMYQAPDDRGCGSGGVQWRVDRADFGDD